MTKTALSRRVSFTPSRAQSVADILRAPAPAGPPPRPARVLAFASRYDWLALRRRRAQIAARHALGLR